MDALETDLCRLLGVELPIVQAPIGSASGPSLAAAVSNAGGLSMLALSWTAEDSVRRVIRETRGLTDRPFGVNLVLERDQRERPAGRIVGEFAHEAVEALGGLGAAARPRDEGSFSREGVSRQRSPGSKPRVL